MISVSANKKTVFIGGYQYRPIRKKNTSQPYTTGVLVLGTRGETQEISNTEFQAPLENGVVLSVFEGGMFW